jgi:hypothetical protein
MFTAVASIQGPTSASAETLVFDCQGTYVSSTTSEAKPIGVSQQITIDPDKGTVEAPGGGDSEHCTSGTDWSVVFDLGAIKLLSKIVKACTILSISETEYSFNTTRELAEKKVIKGKSEYETKNNYWARGSLNRISGKFDATEHFGSSDWTRWQMTCASPQRKSR